MRTWITLRLNNQVSWSKVMTFTIQPKEAVTGINAWSFVGQQWRCHLIELFTRTRKKKLHKTEVMAQNNDIKDASSQPTLRGAFPQQSWPVHLRSHLKASSPCCSSVSPGYQHLPHFNAFYQNHPLLDMHPLLPWEKDPNLIHLWDPRDWLWADTQVTMTDDFVLEFLLEKNIPHSSINTGDSIMCKE